MTAAPRTLTAPVEDYLKTIYEIERHGGVAQTTDIAQRLDIAPASVSGMVRRLSEQGLLAYERYRGVRLTRRGRLAALRTLRRHRIIEAYLTSALGYGWDTVHEEAERLEHSASDELIERMDAAIGHPRVDPHGAPIPTAEGAVDETEHRAIADMVVGEAALVSCVRDEDGDMLRYLAEIGITPGARITLVGRGPFDGPLTLELDGVERVIGPALAGQVWVSPDAVRGTRNHS